MLSSWLLEQRLVEQSTLDRIEAELTTEMDAAVDFAVNAAYPDPDKVGQDVYA
jgi:TPP-dependent pyruvate/acetoin dehydrogenase alpha subunit